MSRDEIDAMVKELTATVMKVDAAQVSSETDLRNDLDADSLDVAEINVLLEERLGTRFGEERFKGLSTIEDVVGMVERQVGSSA